MECWEIGARGWVACEPARYPVDTIEIFKDVAINRHCERSETIHSFSAWHDGLLRCARNDGGYSFAISRRTAPDVCKQRSPFKDEMAQCRVRAAPGSLVCNVHKESAHTTRFTKKSEMMPVGQIAAASPPV